MPLVHPYLPALLAACALAGAADPSRLTVDAGGRFLRDGAGAPFTWTGDTPWDLFRDLGRADAALYLDDDIAKGFNLIQCVVLAEGGITANAQGDLPFATTAGRPDPAKPLMTAGSDPADAAQYDFWDHIDHVVDLAAAKGVRLGFLPTWGEYVAGTWDGTSTAGIIFDTANARSYGEFLGRRYGARTHLVWMLGGDRSAVYGTRDYRPVWRAMAEGIAFGATGIQAAYNAPSPAWEALFMTYHPRRTDHPGSSLWFHGDAWLDVNGVESTPADIPAKIRSDWAKTPVKPTLMLEGYYEASSRNSIPINAWRVRYQAWTPMMAGAAGQTYGHELLWHLGSGWKDVLNAPGRSGIIHLRRFFDHLGGKAMARVPDSTLITSGAGTMAAETLVIGSRGGDGSWAVAYATTGATFSLAMSRLADGSAAASWYSPRSGRWWTATGESATPATAITGIPSGAGAADRAFDPPGAAAQDNDWVLLLEVAAPQAAAPLGINLNGPAVTIAGLPWRSHAQALVSGLSFTTAVSLAATTVTPTPAVDTDTAAMLNRAVWNSNATLGLRQTVAAGPWDVQLFVMENHRTDHRSFDVRIEGVTVAAGIGRLALGQWVAYGPYRTTVTDGALDLELVQAVGSPHLMGLVLTPVVPPPAVIRVNFQPAAATPVDGWLVDAGTAFSTQGGQSYGWAAVNATARERNLDDDQLRDTLIHLQKDGADHRWEIALPPGWYEIELQAGDPGYTDSVHRIAVEGVLAAAGTPTAASRFISGAATVRVDDGRLTVTNATGAVNNKLCWIAIRPLPTAGG